MKVVHIEWIDPAFAKSGWMLKGEFDEWIKEGINRSDTVGILFFESKEMVVVIQSVGKNQVADCIKITRKAIQKMTVLADIEIDGE